MKNKSVKGRVKLFSLLAVAMMMLMAFAMAMPAEESDADATSYYRYEMTYSGEQITQIDIYTSSTAASPAKTITTKNAVDSFWTFTDGYGPFNSCYAAVDSTGAIAFHLNPNNLKQKLDGTSYTTSNYNIVWLVPTVYWSATSTKLTMCSESFSGASAYAHTIGGSVHKYIGIGVYEASKSTFGGVSNCLMSQTGQTPTVSTTIVDFDTYAHNTPGNTMLWNFYQWTLTKMATYTVGMGKNSQQIFGAGLTSGSAKATTGLGDSAGAIVTGQTSYSKVFIENSWGSVYEWVGDTVFSSKVLYAGQNASGVTYTATTGKTAGGTLPSSNWISETYKDAAYWDLPKSSTSSSNASNTNYPGDYVDSNSGTRVLLVGGYWGNGTNAGVACAYASYDSTRAYNFVGARLAYYFDADPAASSPASYDHSGLTGAGQSASGLATQSTNNISGGSLTLEKLANVGNYVHIGWYYNGTYYNPTATVTGLGTSATFKSVWHSPVTIDKSGASGTNTTVAVNSSSTYNGEVTVTVSALSNTNNWAHYGWSYGGTAYSETSKTITVSKPTGGALVSGTDTIIALWKPTVNFDHSALSDKGISTSGLSTTPVVVNSGASYILTDLGVVEDYTHVGWIIPGVDNNTVQSVTYTITNITAPITVSSYWLEPMITITFVYTPQNVDNPTTHTLGTLQVPKGSIGILFTPDLEDMYDATFEGWYDDAALTTAHSIYTTLNSDITLYAKATAHLAFTSSPVANATITRLDSYSSIFAFSAVNSKAAYKITWDFGDGSDAEHGVYAYHEFNDDQKHIVTLTVENYNGEISTIQNEVLGTGYSAEKTTEAAENGGDDNTMVIIGAIIAGIIAVIAVLKLAGRF